MYKNPVIVHAFTVGAFDLGMSEKVVPLFDLAAVVGH
jgi:hypothetical protein